MASSKPRGKGKNASNQKYSLTNYRITQRQERFLRHASVYLEIKEDPINSPQDMIEDAINKYIELLTKRKGLNFPDYLSGTEPSSTPTPES